MRFIRNTKIETSTEKNLPIYQLQTPSDLTWQAKIVSAINSIRLKNKKRVTSQRIFSFINKGALQLFTIRLSKIQHYLMWHGN